MATRLNSPDALGVIHYITLKTRDKVLAFRRPEYARLAVTRLRAELLAYVIMPDHLLTLVDAVEALELAPTDITRRALDDDEARVHLLFQFTAEQLKQSNSLFAAQPDRDLYEAFVFLALDLREGNYSRSDVAALARQFNQPFASPVIVLLRHGQTLSLASVARRLNLNDKR